MSKIDDLIRERCPGGVPFRPLGEIGEFVRGNGLQKADLTDAGVPAIHYGQIHTAYGVWTKETESFTSTELASRLRRAKPGDLVIATTSEDDSAVAKATAWLGDTEAAVSGDAYIFRHALDPKYVAYFFQSCSFQEQKNRHITGTKVRRISGEALARIVIPVPPLEVQREIVRILDAFTELVAELVAELEARRVQYQRYRAKLLAFEECAVEWSTLGGVSVKVSSGGTPTSGRAEYYGGDIPWLRTQEVDFAPITGTAMTITEAGLQNSSAKWIPAHCVIIAMYGATAAKVAVNEIPLTTNQACCNLEINQEVADYRFVYHWVASQYERLRSLGEGSQSNLNAKKVREFPIPVPPMSVQKQIVRILDRFDALVNSLTDGLPAEIAARRKQYAYYRDRLLSFEETAV